ncbi:MAG: hypothetical protein CMR00_00215 [[Chlorobium] sp. 445]|nr:MAG: hypothetical protein CMR00_00215 [[Chlorobium] sp. 445]
MLHRYLGLLWAFFSVLGVGSAAAQLKPMYVKPLESSLAPLQIQQAHAERNEPHKPVHWFYTQSDSANKTQPQARTYISSAALKAWAFKQDFWFSRDKVQHFAACFFIAFSSRIAATSILGMQKSAANAFAGGIATFAGFMREVKDDHEYNNIFSTKDMVANLLGVLLAMVILTFI